MPSGRPGRIRSCDQLDGTQAILDNEVLTVDRWQQKVDGRDSGQFQCCCRRDVGVAPSFVAVTARNDAGGAEVNGARLRRETSTIEESRLSEKHSAGGRVMLAVGGAILRLFEGRGCGLCRRERARHRRGVEILARLTGPLLQVTSAWARGAGETPEGTAVQVKTRFR